MNERRAINRQWGSHVSRRERLTPDLANMYREARKHVLKQQFDRG
ncbi:MAG TPA: hypothetical protein VKZ41_11365 [Gemmatimonadales bacterium]|nr:hypothetical protein [Gemmatimonadales bacterium]